MVGGAWPFLVGGLICLVNSDNERDLILLISVTNFDPGSGRFFLVSPALRGLVGAGRVSFEFNVRGHFKVRYILTS